jgi:transposase
MNSADLTALVLAQTRGPGASAAGVALSHGLHPNMVRRWLREEHLKDTQVQQQPPSFVALPVPTGVSDVRVAQTAGSASGTDGEFMRIELQRTGTTITMNWPVTAAARCAQALREWLR